MVTPAARREVVAYLQERHHFSQRRACRVAGAPRATVRYQPRRPEPGAAAGAAARAGGGPAALRLPAADRPGAARAGRGQPQAGLPALSPGGAGGPATRAQAGGPGGARRARRRAAPGQRWAMDFMQDSLASGRPFRTLNIVDLATRECLAIEVDTSLPGARVVRVLERLCAVHGRPTAITMDNGPEFAGLALDAWAYKEGVQLDFIEPGQADAERPPGELQRQVPRRVPQPALVHRPGRRAGDDRRLARRRQQPSGRTARSGTSRRSISPSGSDNRESSQPDRHNHRGQVTSTRRNSTPYYPRTRGSPGYRDCPKR